MHHQTRLIVESVLGGGAAQWFISAFVSTMPPLPAGSNYWGKWAYAFLHALAANIDKVHIPNSPEDLAAEAKNSKP